MNTRWYYGIAAVVVMIFMVPMIPAEDAPGPVTLTGEVTVHEETEEGEIVSIYLADTEKGNVLISKDGIWEELLDYLDEEIEATGAITKASMPMFSYTITVSSFSSPDDYEDE